MFRLIQEGWLSIVKLTLSPEAFVIVGVKLYAVPECLLWVLFQ
jgi:hypothetical protein